ncbi:hypothetical protein ENSA5_58490 [Enhygromyxa salina]|uniref:Uncharacterized protein n=1 Tax=Enhygromyxa salina TaxID=215803 RepID=A0A2S9XE29_9BACT|nr:hypothetical protein [Enhygromyxa salina]PRP91112.1 hypothetical protein ENSA5_58490 [Enhygromyxa salina]
MSSDAEHDDEPEAGTREASPLELLIESTPARGPEPGVHSLVGMCTDARHPTLSGRVCVRWTDANGEHLRWLPVLHNLAIRERDQVLLLIPANTDGPVVIGVVDGFAKRPEPRSEPKHTVTLKPDESIRVVSEDGTELVAITPGESGPELRLLSADADLRLPGKLRLRAKAVTIEAEEGGVNIEANHDVNVRGEIVHLN